MEIEKNIPITPERKGRRKGIDILHEMEPGDSVLFNGNESHPNTLRMLAARNGWKVTQRKTEDGIRIGRIA